MFGTTLGYGVKVLSKLAKGHLERKGFFQFSFRCIFFIYLSLIVKLIALTITQCKESCKQAMKFKFTLSSAGAKYLNLS